MNHSDEAFLADADIDASLNATRQRKGAGRVHAGKTVIHPPEEHGNMPASSEETPLLGVEGGAQGDDDSSRGYDSGNEGAYADSLDVEISTLPWWKRPSIYWILPIFLFSTIAFGGVMVPQVNLILELVCRNYIADRTVADPSFSMAPVTFGHENPQCRNKDVQARVAQFTLCANAISGLLSAITAPKLGALSDRYGRRKFIVVSSIGSFFKELVMIKAARDPDTFPISIILIGFALEGLSGSFTTMIAIVHSYATDITAPAKRSAAFGYFHSCLFIGIAIGPLLAGKVIEITGTVLTVFYIALSFHVLFMLNFLFIIPESLSKSRQLVAREKYQEERSRLTPAADWVDNVRSLNILEPLKILYPKGPSSNAVLRRNLMLLSAIDTIIFGVAMGSMTVIVIYVNYEFGWDTVQTSIFTSIVNSCRVVCLVLVLPLISWIFQRRQTKLASASTEECPHQGANALDLNVIRFAVFSDTIGCLGYTLARSGPLFTLSGCLAAAGGIGSPTLQSALTKHVPPNKTGQVLGANGLLHALARVAGPAVLGGIYSVTVGKYTQAIFACLTTVFFIAFICSWFIRPNIYLNENDTRELPENPYQEEIVA